MASQAMDIVNTLGLHARAAGKFSALAAEFPCQIRVTRGQRTVDGKSIMGLMMLAAGCGSQILVEAEGTRPRRRWPPSAAWWPMASTKAPVRRAPPQR